MIDLSAPDSVAAGLCEPQPWHDEVRTLLREGHSIRQAAWATRKGLNTVRRFLYPQEWAAHRDRQMRADRERRSALTKRP